MKFSDVSMLMLVIAGVVVLAVLAVTDMNNAYPNSKVNVSQLDKYNRAEGIQNETDKLKAKWEDIESEDTGWKKFVSGLAAVPNVILAFPKLVFATFGIATSIITNGATDLGVPLPILGIIIGMVVVFMMYGLVAWWQRSRT
jgi:hypothetical protein